MLSCKLILFLYEYSLFTLAYPIACLCAWLLLSLLRWSLLCE